MGSGVFLEEGISGRRIVAHYYNNCNAGISMIPRLRIKRS
jgi:hypothetical protein